MKNLANKIKTLKTIRIGTAVAIGRHLHSEWVEGNASDYFFRGAAADGNVHLKCFTSNHVRNRWGDVYLKNTEKAKIIKLS